MGANRAGLQPIAPLDGALFCHMGLLSGARNSFAMILAKTDAAARIACALLRVRGVYNRIKHRAFFGVKIKMLVIDKNSKKGRSYINSFLNRPVNKISLPTLSECYGKYSFAKFSAYNECYSIIEKYVTKSDSDVTRIIEDYGIISFNSFQFTFGARIFCHDEEFDIQYYEYIVITKSYIYLIK